MYFRSRKRSGGMGALHGAPFNTPYTQQCPRGSITLAHGTDAWHPNLCQFPDVAPAAPAAAPVSIVTQAPPVTVSPVIQTQISPQISPAFQQQYQPTGSPMTAGTTQTAPTSQQAAPYVPPAPVTIAAPAPAPTAGGSGMFPTYAPGPVTLDMPEDVAAAPLPVSAAPVAQSDFMRYVPLAVAGFAGLLAIVVVLRKGQK